MDMYDWIIQQKVESLAFYKLHPDKACESGYVRLVYNSSMEVIKVIPVYHWKLNIFGKSNKRLGEDIPSDEFINLCKKNSYNYY